jgi:hypothetical protein
VEILGAAAENSANVERVREIRCLKGITLLKRRVTVSSVASVLPVQISSSVSSLPQPLATPTPHPARITSAPAETIVVVPSTVDGD